MGFQTHRRSPALLAETEAGRRQAPGRPRLNAAELPRTPRCHEGRVVQMAGKETIPRKTNKAARGRARSSPPQRLQFVLAAVPTGRTLVSFPSANRLQISSRVPKAMPRRYRAVILLEESWYSVVTGMHQLIRGPADLVLNEPHAAVCERHHHPTGMHALRRDLI